MPRLCGQLPPPSTASSRAIIDLLTLLETLSSFCSQCFDIISIHRDSLVTLCLKSGDRVTDLGGEIRQSKAERKRGGGGGGGVKGFNYGQVLSCFLQVRLLSATQVSLFTTLGS